MAITIHNDSATILITLLYDQKLWIAKFLRNSLLSDIEKYSLSADSLTLQNQPIIIINGVAQSIFLSRLSTSPKFAMWMANYYIANANIGIGPRYQHSLSGQFLDHTSKEITKVDVSVNNALVYYTH